MRGSIFSEQSKIRFKQIITTRKMCPPTNKEAQFIKVLERNTRYKLKTDACIYLILTGTL